MDVRTVSENEDGSAVMEFDLTAEEARSLLRFGILEALKAGIREGERLKVEGVNVE